ncbi:MAG: UvrD-helicase domain-containing protein [Bacteroidales bacterium]|jgi:ATP-dependent exoDNAse (exonuclease V) beta subunit|nr:UvrD-helicase domain-containing protein [Bacteroidales bacterium]
MLIYRASAGSGKTYQLALKYIRQLLIGDPKTSYRHILAVTFTNDAAAEMKERILGYLYALANGKDEDFLANLINEMKTFRDFEGFTGRAPAEMTKQKIMQNASVAFHAILHDYSNFHISTIDSFFQTILKNLTKELGINSRFEIELNTDIVLQDAVKKLIHQAPRNTQILSQLEEFVSHKFDHNKWNIENDLQKFGRFVFNETFQKNENAVNKENGDKIIYAINQCKEFVKIFDNKMLCFANEFGRQDKKDFHYGDMWSYFNKIRNKEYSEIGDRLSKILTGEVEGKIGDVRFLPLLKKVENFKNTNIQKYNSSKLFLKFIYQLSLLKAISDEISEENKENNRFMLAQTNQLLSSMLNGSDANFIYEKIGANIRSVVIDEFQDTSELQWQNFKILLSEILASNHFAMLVGDVKQSIYRWRNGNWRILNDIEKEFGTNAEYRELDTNYRSAKNIVEFNNVLFENAANILQDDASDDVLPYRKAYKDVKQKPNKNIEGFVGIDFVDKDTMLETIAKKIHLLLTNGVAQGDICILCRKNEQIRLIANELSKTYLSLFPADFPNGTPLKIISEEAYFLSSSPELRVLISALRAINEPSNPIPKAEIEQYLGQQVHNIYNFIEIRHRVSRLPLYNLIEELCRFFKFSEKPKAATFLFAFMDKVLDFTSKNRSDLGNFLNYWDEKLSKETMSLPVNGKRDGILVMSIHKSKGLEFHSIIVPFIDWDMAAKSTAGKENVVWCESSNKIPPFNFALLPVEYSKTMENSIFNQEYNDETVSLQMDNLNVLYVALTRAGKNLVAIAKTPNKKGELTKISDLLYKCIGNECKNEECSPDEKKFETGKIEASILSSSDSRSFKFVSQSFNPQSSKIGFIIPTEVALFAKENNEDTIERIKRGNIIHKIFENLDFKGVQTTIEALYLQGIISASEKENYVNTIENYLNSINVKDWFSEKYEVMKECSIIVEDGNVFRPDRVLIDKEKNVIVIDYKTGKEKKSHLRQVENYVKIMLKMRSYSSVKGYIWYLEDNKIVCI